MFSCHKACLFLLIGINFSLTNFSEGYQTWETKKNNLQENEFLETNKAKVYDV
jgi:hypothetical protein